MRPLHAELRTGSYQVELNAMRRLEHQNDRVHRIDVQHYAAFRRGWTPKPQISYISSVSNKSLYNILICGLVH